MHLSRPAGSAVNVNDWCVSCRYDEPGAWYAMLPLEIVYAFDPIPPPPPEYLTLADTLAPRADRCIFALRHSLLFAVDDTSLVSL